jgi:hypothetical protein
MTSNPLQILAPSAFGPRDLHNELLNRQRTLTVYALLMLAAMLPTLVLAVVDDRTLREVGVWAKPLKFMASTALFALTTTWFTGLLPQNLRNACVTRAVVWTLVWSSLFEVAYISLQAALGSPSHYNIADPFHAAMFVLMAVAAVLLTGTQAVLAWQIYRHSPQQPLPVATQAVLAGLVLTFVLSTVSGFMLGGHQPPAGSGLPIAGWHLGGGDLRPAHFLGVHAQQLIPLAGLLLQRHLPKFAAAGLWLLTGAYVTVWLLLARLGMLMAG